MIATNFDHQWNWWKECECEDCLLKNNEWRPCHSTGTEFPGGLHYEGAVSRFAHEPVIFLLRCYICDKLYVAMETRGEVPVIYPVNSVEEAGLMFNFWNGDRIK